MKVESISDSGTEDADEMENDVGRITKSAGRGEKSDEDEFCLSHVESIVVKGVPVEKEKQNSVGNDSSSSSIHSQQLAMSNESSDSRKFTHLELEEIQTDDATPATIGKSPYEPNLNAEDGVKAFIRMKRIISDKPQHGIASAVSVMFGEKNAIRLLRAAALIDKSGMVYSQDWTSGNIRGNPVGKIPNKLLLLCLVSSRFVKAGELLLSGVVRGLDALDIIKDGLKKWNLQEEYYRINESKSKHLAFTKKKRDCYKCEIFVVRAFSCVETVGFEYMTPTLLSTVRQCLNVMESRLPDDGPLKRKSDSIATAMVATYEHIKPPEATPPKRKKSRPPKPIKAETVPSAVGKQDDLTDVSDYDNQEQLNSQQEQSLPSQKNGDEAVEKKRSLQELLEVFEEKYNQMGEIYTQMGQTLGELKQRAQGNIAEPTRDEIREELLHDVHKAIFKTLK